MKKLNKNIFLFIFAAVFICLGFGFKYIRGLGGSVLGILDEVKSGGVSAILSLPNSIDSRSNKNLRYHSLLMDVSSIYESLLGTRVVIKDGDAVVKTDSGSLIEPRIAFAPSLFEESAEKIGVLKTVAEENGARFLYCAAPYKEYYETAPQNVENAARANHSAFVSSLREAGIPVLDFAEAFNGMQLDDADLFYYTDHHWKAGVGFAAAGAVCDSLQKRYGFEYNGEYADIQSYDVKSYPNWSLGSKGKKVGTWFTNHGADDFELITPKFETDMTEKQPMKNSEHRGSFEDTVLFMDNLKKDYYGKNTYAVYSGGDFRLQIMCNNLNPNGKKVLLIRDSFACVVAPFLALQTSELHVCDVRDFDYFVGSKLNIEEYIREISPDYVLVLYCGAIAPSDSRFDFF